MIIAARSSRLTASFHLFVSELVLVYDVLSLNVRDGAHSGAMYVYDGAP